MTVEVQAERRSLVCRVADNGRFVMPADRFRGLGSPAKGAVRVTRTVRAPLDGQGIAGGELVLAVSSSVPVQVR